MEEERRLAYVALTRAKEKAFVYYTMPDKPSAKATNSSRFVLEGKINLAQDLGAKLYQPGKLPYYSSPVAEEYCRRMGREQDVAEPPVKKVVKSPTAKAVSLGGSKQTDTVVSIDGEYSYKWAMQQPLPDNAEKVIRAMVKTKNAKYLDGEINRIIRELQSVSETKKKVLVNRLIVAANARSMVRR